MSPDLSAIVRPEWALIAAFPSREALLDRGVDMLVGDLPASNGSVFRCAIHARERLTTTALGGGLAIPHARQPVNQIRLALIVAIGGVDFSARDGLPVHLAAMLLSREDDHAGHLRHLAAIAARLADRNRRASMISAQDPRALIAAFLG